MQPVRAEGCSYQTDPASAYLAQRLKMETIQNTVLLTGKERDFVVLDFARRAADCACVHLVRVVRRGKKPGVARLMDRLHVAGSVVGEQSRI